MKSTAVLIVAAGMAMAQAPPNRPAFDVVSVKQIPIQQGQRPVNPACIGGSYHAPARGVIASILYAYNLQTYQLTGVPDWTHKNDALFDIEAKSAGPVGEPECRQMVQSMLADRFKLQIHRETKSMSVMALVVGKNGAKLVRKTDADQGNVVSVNGTPGYDGEKGWTMAQLAEFSQRNFPGFQVVDRTGLDGSYRIQLNYEIQAGTPPSDAFVAAIESQLGLKLENRKEQMEMVVVDRLEKPGAN